MNDCICPKEPAPDGIIRMRKDCPVHGMAKHRGAVMHEDLMSGETDSVAELYAKQIESQVELNFKFVGKQVNSVRTIDNVGWERRAVILTFGDGTAVRIAGRDLEVKDYVISPSDDVAFKEIEGA